VYRSGGFRWVIFVWVFLLKLTLFLRKYYFSWIFWFEVLGGFFGWEDVSSVVLIGVLLFGFFNLSKTFGIPSLNFP